jgi:hypothetical protein
LFTDAVDVGSLPALTVFSIYTRHGDLLAFACLIAMGMGFVIKEKDYIKRRFLP